MILLSGTAEGEGLVGLQPYHFFAWVEDGYVIFIGVENMMARKCMINGGTVTPNVCLSWPDFLALPLQNGLRGP